MRKIVSHYQTVVTEYIVDCDDDEDAIEKFNNHHPMSVQINLIPTVKSNLKIVVREINNKDIASPEFGEALNELNYKSNRDIDKHNELQVLWEMMQDEQDS